ncbi:aspartate/glutamate racemase family protein [Streptomyces tateyamensis]|uniref:aspartate/glutamate racemase family protein n=1 Tax=Streptomyces tateyamensis TaxID=565073 RepID=UPI001FE90C04|nr:aspartate/glutamate racemase family protein [Streptomyces tateyamensis]
MISTGFLHTSPVHVPAFRALVAELAPEGTAQRHLVDEELLELARAGQPYREQLAQRLAELAGCDVVVVTCTSIGGAAEELLPQAVRVDRPMAEAAAKYPRVGVAYTVDSTLAPTTELLTEAGAAQLVEIDCRSAWPHFDSGDLPAYHATVAELVRTAVGEVDAVVLAQASMDPAAALLVDLPVPVLTSPLLAVRRALGLS